MRITNVYQVAAHRLCCGCGACASYCPEKKVDLVDFPDDGIRPVISMQQGCDSCRLCLQICPGIDTASMDEAIAEESIRHLAKRWGPIMEMWEGYAADPDIRFRGASGGICTALSLYCLEKKHAGSVLHIGADLSLPWRNKTYISSSRDEILERTGSRYAPASPCESMDAIVESAMPSVFIGKPCDIMGLRKVGEKKPQLVEKTFLAIGFFCAGTPSTNGTLELLRTHDIDVDNVAELRYRGMGWPGCAYVREKNRTVPSLQMSYEDSWGFVQKFRPFRCYLCPDLTAESADISVGDPWYREKTNDEPGRSLILIRTTKGRELFHSAIKHGYIKAQAVDPQILYRSQKNLLTKRQAIWGRLVAMKLLGVPVPQLSGFHLFKNWLDLPVKEKIKSILGTARRVIQRNYFKPVDFRQKSK